MKIYFTLGGIISIVLTSNFVYVQWSATAVPTPLWTNQNVVISEINPIFKKLHIKTEDVETVTDQTAMLNLGDRQLRLS